MAGIFSAIEISGSGMSVQRQKMNAAAENMANAETTSTVEGGPYRRRRIEVSSEEGSMPFQTVLDNSQADLACTDEKHLPSIPSATGNTETVVTAKAREIVAGEDDYRLVYDPTHPDADDKGYVKMPNIEIINEMVDMMSANRAYEANAMAISASKEMLKNALEI